jgi:hypothetical protein
MFDPAVIATTVTFLAGLAGPGRALEFAIGAGRVALPLARKGFDVAGIELSRAMVDLLRQKPGGANMPVAIGDMTNTRVPGRFSLVYLVFNTINNLTTQDAQVACFQNAADHPDAGGHFVIEVGIPALQRLPIGETLVPFDLGATHWGVDEYFVVSQAFVSHHMHVRDGKPMVTAVPFRYVWPSELDLMARIAGMTLAGRFANWQRDAFTASSQSHVSVWQKRR